MGDRVETPTELFKKIQLWKEQQSATSPDSSSYRAWQRRIDAAQARLNELCPEERAVAEYKADLVALNSESEYQALCNSDNCDQPHPHPMSDHINVIIPNLLYLGDSVVASNRTWLVGHNIQAIVNVAEVDGVITNHEELEGRYLSFKVDDHYNAMQQIEQCFERAKDFLLQHHEQKTAVLVHCKQGISRSSTLVIAYLMHLKKWSLRQAMDVVKAARKKVAPNGGFMRALLQMEYALHGKQSMEEKDFPEPLELGFQEFGGLRVVDGERRKSCSSSSGSRSRSNSCSGGGGNMGSPVVCVLRPPFSPPLPELRTLSSSSSSSSSSGEAAFEMDTTPGEFKNQNNHPLFPLMSGTDTGEVEDVATTFHFPTNMDISSASTPTNQTTHLSSSPTNSSLRTNQSWL